MSYEVVENAAGREWDRAERAERAFAESVEERTRLKGVIVEVLCGQALADHLGDVRDEEQKLWQLLGVERPVYDNDSAWRNTRDTLRRHGIPLPEWLESDDEEDS